jgi:hypothetical protein
MSVVEIDAAHRGSSAAQLTPPSPGPNQKNGLFYRRIIHAHSDDGLLKWSYTSGLRESIRHPEFLMTGLDPFLSESVLLQLMEQVFLGHQYSESEQQKDLLHRLTCAFCEVPSSIAHVLMPLAHTIVDGQELRALQVVYPDNHNRLPWHLGYNTSWHEVQPLLTSHMPLTKVELELLRAAAGVNGSAATHTVHQRG